MNKIYLVLFSGMVLLSFANCGKKDDDKKGAVDMSAMCYQLQTQGQAQAYASAACAYNYSAASGGVMTNYGSTGGMYSYTSGYAGAGCSGNTSAVYSSSKGLGCVINSYISLSGQPAQYALSPATATFVTVSSPNLNNPYAGYGAQTYGMSNIYGAQSYGQTVFRACEDNDKCPESQSCRSPYPASQTRIGICYHN